MASKDVPKYSELIQPTFQALKKLGGSGRNGEILDRVIEDLNLPDDVVDVKYESGSSANILSNRIAWARLYLSKAGIIENSERGVWAIKSDFMDTDSVDADEIVSLVHKMSKSPDEDANEDDDPETNGNDAWREEALQILQTMDFFGFEKLCCWVLRESGFEDVEVTKKTGDKGIDGRGKYMINGLMSFNVAFQAKRYSGTVGSGEIRDFRGSLPAGIERGIFVTTGTFTKSAKEEAADPSKQQIVDLMDGPQLVEKLKELGLGIRATYRVDREFFDKL